MLQYWNTKLNKYLNPFYFSPVFFLAPYSDKTLSSTCTSQVCIGIKHILDILFIKNTKSIWILNWYLNTSPARITYIVTFMYECVSLTHIKLWLRNGSYLWCPIAWSWLPTVRQTDRKVTIKITLGYNNHLVIASCSISITQLNDRL